MIAADVGDEPDAIRQKKLENEDRPEFVAYQQAGYFVVQRADEPKQAVASDLTVGVRR